MRRPTAIGLALAFTYALGAVILALDLLVWRPF